jgi:DNA-binding MurR/RpiR family transcriptional regulator
MSVLSRIESMKNELSLSEKKLFAFMEANPEKVPSMTASQLAEATGISAPTVVRFAKKTGFASLTDLKIQLSAESGLRQNANENLGYADVELNEPFHAITSKLSHNAQVTMNETAQLLEEQLMLAAAELIATRERIFVCGIGASSLIAQDIQQKWTRLGKIVVFENDYNLLLPQLVKNEKKSLLWVISNSGHTPEMVHLAEIVKNLGVPILSLTRFGSNPLTKLADVPLQVSRSKEANQRSAATNSIIAHLLAVEVLFYVFLSKNEKLARNIYASRQAIADFREKYL